MIWLEILKETIKTVQPDPKYRVIYRGDSFQLELQPIERSFEAAVYIKSCIKQLKGLDIRLAIGIGDKSFEGEQVSESNGEAFVFSGELLEKIKEDKLNLQIKTPFKEFNREINLFMKLASIIMDHWSANSAEVVKLFIENPHMRQVDMAKCIGISQNTVSERRKRAHLDEILELNELFKDKVAQLL